MANGICVCVDGNCVLGVGGSQGKLWITSATSKYCESVVITVDPETIEFLLCMLAHAHNPSTQKAKAGGSQGPGKPELQKSNSNNNKNNS